MRAVSRVTSFALLAAAALLATTGPVIAQQHGDYPFNEDWLYIEHAMADPNQAAALPGVVASMTTLPVIGVPLAGSHLSGVDALHAIVQMPGGVPVACVAVGKAGPVNAAILAASSASPDWRSQALSKLLTRKPLLPLKIAPCPILFRSTYPLGDRGMAPP